MKTSGENLSIRRGSGTDLTLLAAIEKRVHLCPWNEEQFGAELEKTYSTLLVMTDDETDEVIAGYVVFWLMFNEAQILNIAVDLPFRGLGVARKLIGQVISNALRKKVRQIVLDVRKSNQPAIQLYQSMKFVISQVRKGFYSDGEDAYTMVLQLEDSQLGSEERQF